MEPGEAKKGDKKEGTAFVQGYKRPQAFGRGPLNAGPHKAAHGSAAIYRP